MFSFKKLTKKEKFQVEIYRKRMLEYLKKNDYKVYQQLMPVYKTEKFNQVKYDCSIVLANMYIRHLQHNIKLALQHKNEEGIWTYKAPMGYINYRDRQGRAQIKVDPNMAFKIYHLFIARKYGLSLSQLEKYVISLGDIRRQKSKSHTLNKRKISDILHNPFYAGTMIIKGKTYPHKYPKIISKALFDDVQMTF